eukprot:TRINITY_DN6039_c0_g1_i20.p1 TRINITY_DN6039_c0_g1~~TRINITY_DN6039_c0_g1_i20.p1  ORF type:complete len:103 (-),score=16.74 TRINITY_DN6039_c0_g1_i20:392-700(-)
MLETLQNSVGLISKLTDRVDKMADRLERVCRRCTRTFLSTPSLVLFLTLISYKLEQIGRDKLLHVNKGKKVMLITIFFIPSKSEWVSPVQCVLYSTKIISNS